MSLNSNQSNGTNPQLLQQRLQVREQEINGLKIQNRHLLAQIEELERSAKPNQIDTQFVADEVQRHLDPLLQQLTSTINSSFEILQGTMRGIYQQSQRAQKAVEDMAAHTRDLEIRLNDQRKQDQNFYQDRVFSMIGNFCDRLERQIEIRLKALGTVEIMNSKQNEILTEMEAVKFAMTHLPKNADSGRSDVSRLERQSNEISERIAEVNANAQSSIELVRDAIQQIQNHRAEFKSVRSELKQTTQALNALMAKGQEPEASKSDGALIQSLVDQKQKEIEGIEKRIELEKSNQPEQDVALILSLLRAQKEDLQKAADQAKSFITETLSESNPVSGDGPNPTEENRT